jgi:hypothetical protein
MKFMSKLPFLKIKKSGNPVARSYAAFLELVFIFKRLHICANEGRQKVCNCN